MTSTAAAHRDKRPFQPSITNFFTRADNNDVISARSDNQLQGLNANDQTVIPAVPSSVQSSLINVGMRVRKSVPEGYKTHKTIAPTATATTSNPTVSTVPFSRPSELTPFCGLNKVGDILTSTMPVFASAYHGALDSSMPPDAQAQLFSHDDFVSSQESTISAFSTDSAPARKPLKRSFTDEALDRASDSEDDTNNPLTSSPRSANRTTYPISHTPMPNLSAFGMGRAVAKPKGYRGGRAAASRLRQPERGHADIARYFQPPQMARTFDDKENDVDFPEADFLVPPKEVEMGDV